MTKRPLIPHPDNPLWMLVPLGGKYRGTFAVVDIGDAEEVGRYNWYGLTIRATVYARTKVPKPAGGEKSLYLHRLIAQLSGFGDCEQVDHRNHDGLDCRRSNLRPATHAENQRNQSCGRNNTSGYKGVSWEKGCAKWHACIQVAGKTRHLGLFDTREAAARAYDSAALEVFGPFAILNFPVVPSNDNSSDPTESVVN